MKNNLCVLLATLSLIACSDLQQNGERETVSRLTPERIAEIVASPDRSASDRTNDARRKPEMLLAFTGVRPGMIALDVSAGGGYTTELLARAVGLSGAVYGQSAPPRVEAGAAGPVNPEGNAGPQAATAPMAPAAAPVRRTSAQALAERAQKLPQLRLYPVVRSFEDLVPAELAGKLDMVTFMFNYHDLGHMGTDRARMNAALFTGLKPGGIYVIADHAGRPGTGISEAGTLHRIEQAFLRKEVEAAGFRLLDEGQFLRNPLDPRDKNTPVPPQPKDDFILKFVKP